jgi:hypothetical protein
VTATALSVFRPVAPFGDLPFLASSPLATEWQRIIANEIGGARAVLAAQL